MATLQSCGGWKLEVYFVCVCVCGHSVRVIERDSSYHDPASGLTYADRVVKNTKSYLHEVPTAASTTIVLIVS